MAMKSFLQSQVEKLSKQLSNIFESLNIFNEFLSLVYKLSLTSYFVSLFVMLLFRMIYILIHNIYVKCYDCRFAVYVHASVASSCNLFAQFVNCFA